jgi:hypothetical protein
MSFNIASKRGLWLAVALTSALSAGCPVDINDPIIESPPAEPECPPEQRTSVRFFNAAAGIKVIRPMFGPAVNRSLVVTRPDFLVESPLTGELVPQVVVTLAPGRGQVVRVCGNKELTFDLKLTPGPAPVDAPPARVTQKFTFVPDATRTNDSPTVIFAGIADVLLEGADTPETADDVPENPASVADPLRFILVEPTFAENDAGEAIVVHASPRLGPVVVKTASKDMTPVTSESAAIDAYAVSAPIAVRGSGDGITSAETPVAVDVQALEGETLRGRFSITPRFPAGAKAIVILHDRIVFDPGAPAGTTIPPDQTRIFLTGDDPLLGSVVGGGITLTPL